MQFLWRWLFPYYIEFIAKVVEVRNIKKVSVNLKKLPDEDNDSENTNFFKRRM